MRDVNSNFRFFGLFLFLSRFISPKNGKAGTRYKKGAPRGGTKRASDLPLSTVTMLELDHCILLSFIIPEKPTAALFVAFNALLKESPSAIAILVLVDINILSSIFATAVAPRSDIHYAVFNLDRTTINVVCADIRGNDLIQFFFEQHIQSPLSVSTKYGCSSPS